MRLKRKPKLPGRLSLQRAKPRQGQGMAWIGSKKLWQLQRGPGAR